MALNCVMLGANGKPVPLPDEKLFVSVGGVAVSLSPTELGSPTAASTNPKGKSAAGPTARGEVSVTNQRIIFVADGAVSPARPTPDSIDNIRTLTVPLTHHHDGRFVQPWFSANAHECNISPIADGGLDAVATGAGSFSLRISFNEGRGFEFHEALEEVKRRLHDAQGRARVEPESLPVYSPPSPTAGALPRVSGPSSPPPLASDPDRRAVTRQNTMPTQDDLEAAEVARRAEEDERQVRSESQLHAERGAPPAYDG